MKSERMQIVRMMFVCALNASSSREEIATSVIDLLKIKRTKVRTTARERRTKTRAWPELLTVFFITIQCITK